VGLSSYHRITQIRKVVRLRARTHFGLLQFDEVSDMRAFTDHVLHTQPGEWTGMHAALQARVGDDGVRADHDLVSELGIVHDGAGADAAVLAYDGVPDDACKRLDHRIHADTDVAIDRHRVGVFDGHAVTHHLQFLARPQDAVDVG